MNGVGHQLLSLLEHALRLAAVVEAVEGEDVGGEHALAENLEHPRVDAAALLVSWWAVHDVTSTSEPLDGLKNRRARVVQLNLLQRCTSTVDCDRGPSTQGCASRNP